MSLNRILTLCLFGLCGAAGGWLVKPDSPPLDAPEPRRPAPGVAASVPAKEEGAVPSRPVDQAVARMAKSLHAAEALTPAAFGDRMAELLSKPTFGENLIERALMTSLLDGERMAAVYEAYKRRSGTTVADEQPELREILLATGQNDGKAAMERLLQLHPEGFPEMGSLTYGWAMSRPADAVDWLNSLPVESESRKRSLRGLMSGLAAGDGELAGKVLASLAPEDQPQAALGFANSMIQNHGLEQFDRWLSTADPEIATLAIQQSSFRAGQQPLSQLVPWLVRHDEAAGAERITAAFQKWTRSEPDAAIEWMFQQAPKSGGSDALYTVLTQVDTEAVAQWVSRHPNHPASLAWQEQQKKQAK